MSSRRSVRQLLVAVLLGVLVGGGLMAVTPAGAEVSSAVATNWKKIWKKNLKPLADRRYYKKSQSDAKYATKAEAAAGDAASNAASNAATDSKLSGYYKKTETYSKAEADAKYAAAGSSYSKAESDAKYAPYPSTLRGMYTLWAVAAAGGEITYNPISFGANLAAPPTVVFKASGGAANPNCTGTPAAPTAAPGFLCVYESGGSNAGAPSFFNGAGGSGASSYGVRMRISSSAAGTFNSIGSWAVTPAAPLAAKPSSSLGAKTETAD